MEPFATLSPAFSAGLFLIAAVAVWIAGGRLSILVSGLADRLGLSQGFAGMMLLGGITSLPEIATAGSAALGGSVELAVSNLIGTASANVLLLVVADLLIARVALSGLTRSSSALLQGVFGMVLMIGVGGLAILGDRELFATGVGVGSTGLLLACGGALWLASRYEENPGWTVAADDDSGRGEAADARPEARPLGGLLIGTGIAAAVILVAGVVLSQTAERIAAVSGLGVGLIGLVLVGFATSLPELSSIRTAVRIGRFDLAIGDVLGTNIFNVAVLFVVDLAYRDGPALAGAGAFEAVAALLAAALIGLFIAGLIARRPDRLLRLGASSWGVLATYAAGLVVLWFLQRPPG